MVSYYPLGFKDILQVIEFGIVFFSMPLFFVFPIFNVKHIFLSFSVYVSDYKTFENL